MDKEQKKRRDEKVNKLAEKYYDLRTQNGSESEKNNVFVRLYNEIMKQKDRLAQKYSSLDPNDIESAMHDTFLYQFSQDIEKGWNPNKGPFAGCFFFICKNKIKNYLEKQKKTTSRLVYTSINAETEEEIEPWANIEDSTVQLENELESATIRMMIAERFMHFMNEAVKLKIKQSPNKFCYLQRFYTEWCSRQILEQGTSDFLSLVCDVPDKCVDLQFASGFLNQEVSTLSEIRYRELKMLAEFTGREKDQATPCGFDLKNAVYVHYVTQVTGKAITDSIVSNHRKIFHDLLEMQSGKIGVSNHPIAES